MNDLDTLSWLAEQSGIRSLRAAVCDLNGIMRGKRIPVQQAEKPHGRGCACRCRWLALMSGARTLWNSPLVFSTGDADGICDPIGRGILPINWTTEPKALIPLWLCEDDGTPFLGDPRRALAA